MIMIPTTMKFMNQILQGSGVVGLTATVTQEIVKLPIMMNSETAMKKINGIQVYGSMMMKFQEDT